MFYPVEFLELGIVLENLHPRAIVADAFKNFLDVFHVAVVVDRHRQADMAEVALTLPGLSAGLADLVGGGDS